MEKRLWSRADCREFWGVGGDMSKLSKWLSDDYTVLLSEVKERVRVAQYEALKAVNKELGVEWTIFNHDRISTSSWKTSTPRRWIWEGGLKLWPPSEWCKIMMSRFIGLEEQQWNWMRRLFHQEEYLGKNNTQLYAYFARTSLTRPKWYFFVVM